MKFVHTSDWQLGMTRYFLDADAQTRYSADRIAAIRSIGQVARDHNCDFVVVAGDVFEHNKVDSRTIHQALEAMKDAGVHFYLLPGNHDPVVPGSVFENPLWSTFDSVATVLRDMTPRRFSADLEIIGAPWVAKSHERNPFDDLMKGLEPVRGDSRRVIVAHGAVDVMAPDSASGSILQYSALTELIDQGKANYVALGDKHSRRQVAPAVHYSGSPEVTAFRDEDAGKVCIVDLSSPVPQVDDIRVGKWRFTQIARQLLTAIDVDELTHELIDVSDKPHHVVRLNVQGQLTLNDQAALDRAIEQQSNVFAGLHFHDDSQISTVVDDASLGALDVSGYVRHAVDQLVAESQIGDDEAVAALRLLHLLVDSEGAP